MTPGQLWLYRTKPQDDELFSSWLVRLAHGLAIKLQTLSVHILGMHSNFWTGDVDRHPNREALHRLSDGVSVPMERLYQTGLSGYEGRLWASFRQAGALPWVMPIGRYGRRRLGYGQQFCRRCLAVDEQPYFRRRWRLAFNVVCERHRCFLHDCCPHCRAPIEFHAGDFGRWMLDEICTITRCQRCRIDLREGSEDDAPTPSERLIEFQSVLNDALHSGCSRSLPGGEIYSFLAFEGLRVLARLFCSRSRGRRLRDQMLCNEGRLPLGPSVFRPRAVFEELRVGDRRDVLEWCVDVLQSWPEDFVSLCREVRLSSSYILRYGIDIPYWLYAPVTSHLNDRDYAPSDEEKSAVAAWLSRAGLPVTTNAIRRWLGVAHTHNFGPENSIPVRKRWNSRGPRIPPKF